MTTQDETNTTAARMSVKSDFRRALGQFPTGVTVITTTDDQNRPVGMTVSSFNSVSQEPPLIFWSIDKSALSLKAFSQGQHFVVNVLGKQQADIADNFARRGADKFTNIVFSEGRDGCPVPDGTAACFECKTRRVYEGGDHLIVVGEVLSHHYRDQVTPLVFAQSSYSVPVDEFNTKYVGMMVQFKAGLSKWLFYIWYLLGGVRWMFHGNFSGQDHWMVDNTDAPPERLYRPDVSLIEWRNLFAEAHPFGGQQNVTTDTETKGTSKKDQQVAAKTILQKL